MLLETVADHQFAQAIQTLAEDAAERHSRKQYAVYRINGIQKLQEWSTRILKDNGHIDQIVVVCQDVYMILYTAEHEVRLGTD